MIRPLRTTAIALTLFANIACVGYLEADDRLPSSDFASPNGRYIVRLVPPDADASKEEGNKQLIIADEAHSIVKHTILGYIKEVFWSPNGKYVAIYNRNANSGDYLLVFSLPKGQRVRPINSPLSRASIRKDFPEFATAPAGKEFQYPTGWTPSNRLIVRHDLFFKNQKKYISETLQFDVSNSQLSLARQKIDVKDRW